MSDAYGVIEDELAERLPPAIGDQLRDLGLACGTASLTYQQAVLAEQLATLTRDGARQDDPAAVFRTFGADEHACTAMAAAEQHLATYMVLAATYATFADRVLGAARRRALDALPPANRIAPSLLLADLDVALPPVQLPPEVPDRDLEALLLQARDRLAAEARAARSAGTAHVYDGRAAAADRPTGAVSLSAGLPQALHAYATLLLDAVGHVLADAES